MDIKPITTTDRKRTGVKRKLTFYILFVLLLMLLMPVSAQAGWKKTKKGMKYTISKKPGYLTGWHTIDKERYYFSKKNGIMATGWKKLKLGKQKFVYYFGNDGKARRGLQKVDNSMYFFTVDKGRLQYGFQNINGKRYYANTKNGALAQNAWVDLNGASYYFGNDCTMVVNQWVDGNWIGADGRATGQISYEGFVRIKGKIYYYRRRERQTGFQDVDGRTYYLNPALQTGWFTVGKKKYCADSKGAITKNAWNGKKYLQADGSMAVGWTTINKQKYYFKDNGDRVSGAKKIDGKHYRFTSSGAMLQKAWFVKGKKTYYYQADGTKAAGVVKIDGLAYYFNKSGVMQKKWIKIGKVLYYAHKKKGYLYQNKWFKKKGYTYYAFNDGHIATGLNKIGSRIYGFDKKGRMYAGKFKTIKKKTYYFQPDGTAVTGTWKKINKKYYYFDKDGVMARNTMIDGYPIDANGVRQSKLSDGWKTSGGKKYYVKKGKYVTGLKKISGNYYYFDADGVMQTGLQDVKGKKRYFYPSGIMAAGITLAVGSKEYTINSEGVVTAETTIKVSGSTKGSNIASFAIKYVGNKYVYGGTSLTNGADCSGFVQTVFGTFGISLPRVANDQMHGGGKVVVNANSLQPGDLLFYGSGNYASHVAIYIGNGRIVHASNSQPYPAGGIKISNYDYQTPIRMLRYW